MIRNSIYVPSLLLAGLLCFISCKKDSDDPSPAITPNTSCQMTRVEDETGYLLLDYNTDGRIIKSTSYTKNNQVETVLFSDYANGKLEKIRIFYKADVSGTPDLTATATTDAAGNIQTLTAPFAGGVSTTAQFTYSGSRLTKITWSNNTYRYEYDSQGNVTKIFNQFGSQPEVLQTEYTYDDKINPGYGNVALLVFAVVFGDLSDIYSPHNALTFKNYNGKAISSTSSFVYTYNDKNFPITVKQTISETGHADEVSNTTIQYTCK